MSSKMIKKLTYLISEAKVKWWNGHQIKTCSFGDWDSKGFQVNGKKYKVGIEISTKCNHETKFIPKVYDLKLIDYKTGYSYCEYETIAEFLGLEVVSIKELIKPMENVITYTEEEIQQSIKDYRNFVIVSFIFSFINSLLLLTASST